MKKLVKYFSLVLLIVLIGGLSGVFLERIIMPRIASVKYLNKFSFFRSVNEKVTVIEKTKEVVIKEDFSVREISQKVIPSVVGIVAYKKDSKGNVLKEDTFFDSKMRTGVVLTGDGLIVSSFDLGWNEDYIFEVVLPESDEDFLPATFLGYDYYSNLSFLKVNGSNLSTSPLGDEKDLESGEKLMLIGAANQGLNLTFDRGVLRELDHNFSLIDGELSFSEKAQGAIISDLKIDNGNIGGPVVDFNGNVVGIASRENDKSEAIDYIIPVDKVRDSLNVFLLNEEKSRASLGVYYISLNRVNARINGFKSDKGAMIYSALGQRGLAIIKNSSADLAGLKLGDIILKVDQLELSPKNPLSAIIARYKPGDKVMMTILRGEKQLELEVNLM